MISRSPTKYCKRDVFLISPLSRAFNRQGARVDYCGRKIWITRANDGGGDMCGSGGGARAEDWK